MISSQNFETMMDRKGYFLISFFFLCSLAYAQLVPVDIESTSLATGTCSGTFVTHELEHTTTVPGGENVRMFEANGAGVAINDLDNDGDLDIVLANHAGSNSILWNEGDLQFRREAFATGDSRAVNILDIDGDSWQDIIFSRRVSAPNYWRNEGDGRFELEALNSVSKPLYAINWADLDADGDLDLVGGTYDAGLLTEFGNEFLQSGNAGVYVYWNEAERFAEERLSNEAQALALLLMDLNGDRKPDVLVGNDFAVPDMVWLNQEETWQPMDLFTNTSHSTMSFDMGDLNNDGQTELFATDMKPYDGEALEPWQPIMEAMMSDPHSEGDSQVMENVLQERRGGAFINSAKDRGVDATGWSWSGKFADFDQDGFLDLYVVNGMMEQTTFAHLENHELVEANQAFRNDGAGNFIPAPTWSLSSTESGRGMSIADLDGDGDLDIVVNNLLSPAQLFENQLCTGKSMQVDLHWVGTKNAQAIGASLILHTNLSSYHRDITAGSGYLSGNPSRVHFGFPENEAISFLEVVWPDGGRSKLYRARAQELVRLVRR